MPAVEGVALADGFAIRMRAHSSGQWVRGKSWLAMLSVPSGARPAFQRTKPPWRLRQAEPEPRRAAMEREAAMADEPSSFIVLLLLLFSYSLGSRS